MPYKFSSGGSPEPPNPLLDFLLRVFKKVFPKLSPQFVVSVVRNLSSRLYRLLDVLRADQLYTLWDLVSALGHLVYALWDLVSLLIFLLLGYPLLDLLDRLLDVLDPLLERLYPLLDRRDALLMVLKQVILNCSLLIQTVLIVKILVMMFFFYPIERETMILFLLSRSFNILYDFLKN